MINTLKIGNLTIGTLSSGFLLGTLNGFGSPAVKVDVKERGNFHGANLGEHLYGRRIFGVDLEIVGRTAAEYETNRRALEAALDIYDGLVEMVITTKNGLVLKADVIATQEFDLPYVKGNMVFGDARLELTAPYPFLQGFNAKTRTINLWSGGGFEIPFEVPLDMSAGATVVDNVDNDGNAVAFPIITLNGALEDPVITNETTGEEFSLNYTLTNGNYITIDVYNRTILLNGVTNLREYFTGDWMKLVAGANYIKLTATSFDSSGNAAFSYRDSYLGV